jgi:hypothetical protein
MEAQLAAEAQAHGLTFDHYIEMIVRARAVEQLKATVSCRSYRPYSGTSQREQTRGGVKIKDLIHEGDKY